MKIQITTVEPSDNNEWSGEYTLSVNGKDKIWVGHMEPEDAILGRDLSFVYSIPELMRQAYEAGKNGEEFEVIQENET